MITDPFVKEEIENKAHKTNNYKTDVKGQIILQLVNKKK